MKRKLPAAFMLAFALCLAGAARAEVVGNGLSFNGLSFNRLAFNGLSFNRLAFNGIAEAGTSAQPLAALAARGLAKKNP